MIPNFLPQPFLFFFFGAPLLLSALAGTFWQVNLQSEAIRQKKAINHKQRRSVY